MLVCILDDRYQLKLMLPTASYATLKSFLDVCVQVVIRGHVRIPATLDDRGEDFSDA